MKVAIKDNDDQFFVRMRESDDKEAFKELFERYYAPLCIFASRFVRNTSETEDIVQDVFVKLWENRKLISCETSFRNYLLTMVKNQCLNHIKRNDKWVSLHDDSALEYTVSNKSHVESNLESASDLKLKIEKLLYEMPREYRLAFMMSKMQNCSTSEIALKMNVSERSIERYRLKAIDILKNKLKQKSI